MPQLPFKFHQELQTAYPGEYFEVTFSGICWISENEDESDELTQIYIGERELSPMRPQSISPTDWQRFEHKCFAAARDAQYMEACKKERESNPEKLKS